MRVGIQEDDQLDDATRASDDLRAEVAVLRRAVEALGPALKENRSPDLQPDPRPHCQDPGHDRGASRGHRGALSLGTYLLAQRCRASPHWEQAVSSLRKRWPMSSVIPSTTS